ncbi:MAG: hypothetical protein J6C26_03005 [Clostridia bacterium]|nr:hypothetical protein [Clostridia bacterium]
MLINTKYVGFFPLGSDIVLDGVSIMQCPWAACTKTVLAIGGGGPVCPLGGMVFSATQGNSVAFFVAIEEGLGKYHIFSVSKKASEKLKKKLFVPCVEDALTINRTGHSIFAYGRVVGGARDPNLKCPDGIYTLIGTEEFPDHLRYFFTNDGVDRFCLKVYNPCAIKSTEEYITIERANKILWGKESETEETETVEYRPLPYGVEIKHSGKEIVYYR